MAPTKMLQAEWLFVKAQLEIMFHCPAAAYDILGLVTGSED